MVCISFVWGKRGQALGRTKTTLFTMNNLYNPWKLHQGTERSEASSALWPLLCFCQRHWEHLIRALNCTFPIEQWGPISVPCYFQSMTIGMIKKRAHTCPCSPETTCHSFMKYCLTETWGCVLLNWSFTTTFSITFKVYFLEDFW